MRSILGLALLVAASLGAIEYATKNLPPMAATGAPVVEAAITGQPLAPATLAPSFGGLFQTVAAADQPQLPPVTVAPDAPRAAPIEPIVEPTKRPPPKQAVQVKKPAVAHKTKTVKAKQAIKTKESTTATVKGTGVTVTRPGFKLTCTAVQKLDTAKQRCVPLKTNSTASIRKPKG